MGKRSRFVEKKSFEKNLNSGCCRHKYNLNCFICRGSSTSKKVGQQKADQFSTWVVDIYASGSHVRMTSIFRCKQNVKRKLRNIASNDLYHNCSMAKIPKPLKPVEIEDIHR
jgi:hypothetical protein